MKTYKVFFFITAIICLLPSVGLCLDSLSLGGETVRLGKWRGAYDALP